ncbi:16S rRNA (cytidine(1402)-2'-O)-methyltransferase [Salidesulfovibrio brasiliensis]
MPQETDSLRPGLYVVATPLGNDGDLSPRAAGVLQRVELVLAEDTRRTGLLLQRTGVERGGEMTSFHDHNEEKKTAYVLSRLEEGAAVALVSDAGTPLMSDPGFRLVQACRAAGHPVRPVPGPSAPVTALSACGLPPIPYAFIGFPPRKEGQAVRFFEPYRDTGATLVFFERKTRVESTLKAAFKALGDRPYCIARELTKDYEEFLYGSLASPDPAHYDIKGEVTVVIGPPEDTGPSDEAEADAVLAEEGEQGGKPKEIARRAAARLNGWTAKELYARMRR